MRARFVGLSRLEEGEPEVDVQGGVMRELFAQREPCLDRGRIDPEAEVDPGEQVLALRVARLKREGALELLLGLDDAVLHQQLGAPREVKEEVLVRRWLVSSRKKTPSRSTGSPRS